jgi:hypothetical protein
VALLEVNVPALVLPEPYEIRLRASGDDLRWKMSVTMLLAEVTTLALGARALVRARRRDRSARTLVTVFIGFTVLWVVAAGNAFELQENHRFRFMIDPLMFAMLAVGIEKAVRRHRRRTARA